MIGCPTVPLDTAGVVALGIGLFVRRETAVFDRRQGSVTLGLTALMRQREARLALAAVARAVAVPRGARADLVLKGRGGAETTADYSYTTLVPMIALSFSL